MTCVFQKPVNDSIIDHHMIFREFALRGVYAVSLRPRADIADSH